MLYRECVTFWLGRINEKLKQVGNQCGQCGDCLRPFFWCNCAIKCWKCAFSVWAIIFLSPLRAPTENGSSLTAQWTQCGLRIWTQCLTTTRSCVWWAVRSFRCRHKWASSLSPWTWRWHRQPQWETPSLWKPSLLERKLGQNPKSISGYSWGWKMYYYLETYISLYTDGSFCNWFWAHFFINIAHRSLTNIISSSFQWHTNALHACLYHTLSWVFFLNGHALVLSAFIVCYLPDYSRICQKTEQLFKTYVQNIQHFEIIFWLIFINVSKVCV